MLMAMSPNATSDSTARPTDWVDHPKTPITRRAILAGVAVLLLGIVGAVASIYARRTRLELTTEFWGSDAILAMQVSPRVILRLEEVGLQAGEAADQAAITAAIEADNASEIDAASDDGVKTIELTGTPGLGHLRHALLDQRHYDWETRGDDSLESLRGDDSRFATLTFADPLAKFPTTTVRFELTGGWVGRHDESGRVRLNARSRPAVRHFLVVISNAQQQHYDRRKQAEAASEPASSSSIK